MSSSNFLSGAYWVDVFERTVRAFAVTGMAALTTKGVVPIDELPWSDALKLGATGAVLGLMASVAATQMPGSAVNTASFLPAPARTAAKVKAAFTRSGKDDDEPPKTV